MTELSDAIAEVGGLSKPSKMPGRSWSTPAKYCGVGSKLAAQPGTICSICYAQKGTYEFPSTVAAMDRRWKRLQEALADPRSMRRFEDAFATIFRHRLESTNRRLDRRLKVADDGRYFRWHDSGDVDGVHHLALINRLAAYNRGVSFWLPTKEAGVVRSFLETGGVFNSNLSVRISLPRPDMDVPPAYEKLEALSPQVSFAGAHAVTPSPGFERCPAPDQNGECGDCRACWSPIHDVSYAIH
jgi:hypothetical protein